MLALIFNKKKTAKTPESLNRGVFERYRKTYVLNNSHAYSDIMVKYKCVQEYTRITYFQWIIAKDSYPYVLKLLGI